MDLINCALLLGSDYTDGIRGIGAVSARDIVSHFKGPEGLKKFRDWIVNGIENAVDDTSKRWFQKHKNLRQKIKALDQHFPSREVVDAYLRPVVDSSNEEFEWNCPDLDALREFCLKKFGWDIEQTDNKVVPIVQRYNQTLSQSQRRIETFFLPLMRKDKTSPKAAKNAVSSAATVSQSVSLTDDEPQESTIEFGFFDDEEFVRLAEELEESPQGKKKQSRAKAVSQVSTSKRKRAASSKPEKKHSRSALGESYDSDEETAPKPKKRSKRS